jgi:hypothetical protein
MKLHVDETLEYLVIDECTSNEYEQLKLSYNKKTKNYRFAPTYKSGLWDGNISFLKGKYLPASSYKYLFDVCEQYSFPCEIEGIEKLLDNDIDYDEFKEWCDNLFKDAKKKPRYYQIEAAYRMLKYKRCMIQLATGGGKTFIAFMVFAYLLQVKKVRKIMMVVPKVDLVLQPTADFNEYNQTCNLDIKIQQIFSGCKANPDANVYIGTYQSLRTECAEYFTQFDVVLSDECLHTDTLITMSDGSKKKISEIEKGEKVFTFNTNTKKKEIHEVDYVYKNLSKNQQMYEIEMENGTILKVTGNHKILLTSGEWKRVDKLTKDDEIVDSINM